MLRGCLVRGHDRQHLNPLRVSIRWEAPVPSIRDQIAHNYTRDGAPADIALSLQFIWTGQNDLSKHTDAFWEGDPQNAEYARNMSECITHNAEHLIELGAPYVVVANIYPKHKAPVTTTYLCPDGSCVETWGFRYPDRQCRP